MSDSEKIITVKCDEVRTFFRVPETALWVNEAARHFAGIIARRKYGRKGGCRTVSLIGNGVVQAFIGTPAPGGGCSGHQITFCLEVVNNIRGGKRKGSGRKPRSVPLKAVTVRLEPSDVARLKQLCKEHQTSQAKIISAWINQ